MGGTLDAFDPFDENRLGGSRENRVDGTGGRGNGIFMQRGRARGITDRARHRNSADGGAADSHAAEFESDRGTDASDAESRRGEIN